MAACGAQPAVRQEMPWSLGSVSRTEHPGVAGGVYPQKPWLVGAEVVLGAEEGNGRARDVRCLGPHWPLHQRRWQDAASALVLLKAYK